MIFNLHFDSAHKFYLIFSYKKNDNKLSQSRFVFANLISKCGINIDFLSNQRYICILFRVSMEMSKAVFKQISHTVT